MFLKTTSSDWVSIVMKQKCAKYRFPTLKNQGEKTIPVQSKLFPRLLQKPNTLLVPGIRVISSAESRNYYKHTQHTKPAKLRHYLPGTLQQFANAGTAVHNQQDRRRANDGGRTTAGERRRASDVRTQQIPQQYLSSRPYTYFSNYMMYINSGTAVYNQHERWRASDGGRATYMYVHSNTAVSAVASTFFR